MLIKVIPHKFIINAIPGIFCWLLDAEWNNSSGIGSFLFVAALLFNLFTTSSYFSLEFNHLTDSGTIKYDPTKSSVGMWTDNCKAFQSRIKYAIQASKNSPIWKPIP